MKIFVKAKPSSKNVYVKKVDEINFEVAVHEPPVKGKANAAIINSLAEYFKIDHTRIQIVSGWTSRSKVIEIS